MYGAVYYAAFGYAQYLLGAQASQATLPITRPLILADNPTEVQLTTNDTSLNDLRDEPTTVILG